MLKKIIIKNKKYDKKNKIQKWMKIPNKINLKII